MIIVLFFMLSWLKKLGYKCIFRDNTTSPNFINIRWKTKRFLLIAIFFSAQTLSRNFFFHYSRRTYTYLLTWCYYHTSLIEINLKLKWNRKVTSTTSMHDFFSFSISCMLWSSCMYLPISTMHITPDINRNMPRTKFWYIYGY